MRWSPAQAWLHFPGNRAVILSVFIKTANLPELWFFFYQVHDEACRINPAYGKTLIIYPAPVINKKDTGTILLYPECIAGYVKFPSSSALQIRCRDQQGRIHIHNSPCIRIKQKTCPLNSVAQHLPHIRQEKPTSIIMSARSCSAISEEDPANN